MQRLAFACHIAVLINEKGCATRELATVAERRAEGNVFYRVGGTNIGGKKQVTSFQDLLAEIGAILGLPKEETESKMIQFYTDLNIDGRFISLGDNTWGLRAWYPVDQIDEEVTHTVKTKRKKRKLSRKKRTL